MLVHVIDSLQGVDVQARDWEFDAPRLTLRQLLRERVRREVEWFNTHQPEIYQGLVQPEESEQILNGYRLKRPRLLDPEQQYERAIRSFQSNGFLVLAGGRQVESLDEEIDLEAAHELEFLKLVPLVGG